MKVHLRSPFVWSTGPKWRFRLEENFRIDLGMGWHGTHEFWDGGEMWANLVDDQLEIQKFYSWNGASPCVRVFGRWIGTPTPAAVMIPSLIHDLLWQMLDVPCRPWTQRVADAVFWDLMEEEKWRLRGTYHGAVAIFGGLYRRFSGKNPNAKCSICHETDRQAGPAPH